MSKLLIVLPGWGHNKFTYRKFIRTAPTGWVIEVVDYNKVFKRKSTNQDFIDQLTHYLVQQEKPFYLCGHSLGGALAILFAQQHPELIAGLYLIDAEGIAHPEPFLKAGLKTLHSPKNYGKSHYIHKLASLFWLLKKPKMHYRLGKQAIEANLEKEMREITVPTTLYWGEQDHSTPLWQGEKMHSLIKNSTFHVIPTAGHSWHIYHPESFWQ